MKINLSNQDPTNYHVLNIFQDLGIFFFQKYNIG